MPHSLYRKLQRRSVSPRPDGLKVIAETPDAAFEIVAVHGLAAHPEYTWAAPAPAEVTEAVGDDASTSQKTTHLLRDLLARDKEFRKAKILSFAHNSDWLVDAPITTAEQVGLRLLEHLTLHHRVTQVSTPIFSHL
jgi:hypothetical protein